MYSPITARGTRTDEFLSLINGEQQCLPLSCSWSEPVSQLGPWANSALSKHDLLAPLPELGSSEGEMNATEIVERK
jgi:hypothetical protein